MDNDRQIAASINLLTTFTTCLVWWYAFSKFRRAGVFLSLAIIAAFHAVSSVANIYLAFTERLFIPFTSSASMFAFLRAFSYVGSAVSILEMVAYALLVRWISRNIWRTPSDA